jgi:hypothetical protein
MNFETFVGKREGPIWIYKLCHFVIFFLMFLQLIFDSLCWNSLVRMINIFKDGHGFAGFMCLIEFFVVAALFGGGIWLVFLKVRKLKIW